MKQAAVYAIAELAGAEQSEAVAAAYGDDDLSFGADYLIPKPLRPAPDYAHRTCRGASCDG